jgi:hypothetical protein
MYKSYSLEEVRKLRRIRQNTLAKKLGSNQSNLSTFERRNVIQTKSLQAYIEALGGQLIVTANFEDGNSYILKTFSSTTDKSTTDKDVITVSDVESILKDPTFKAELDKLVFLKIKKIMGL